MQSLILQFLNYSKKYTCKFMQDNSWHHKLFHFHLFFSIWKVWKGRGKITKTWISREWKELFRWNKKHFFTVFEGLSFGKKIKLWKKWWTQQALNKLCPIFLFLKMVRVYWNCTKTLKFLFLCLAMPQSNISLKLWNSKGLSKLCYPIFFSLKVVLISKYD